MRVFPAMSRSLFDLEALDPRTGNGEGPSPADRSDHETVPMAIAEGCADTSPELQLEGMSSRPLDGERITFTGVLASMTHRQGAALVEREGGTYTEHVSGRTTLLVVGEEGWPLENDGLPSIKLQQALQFRQSGGSIRVLTESDWLTILGLAEQRDEVHRLYTPAMLSQSLGVSVARIRRWHRIGLIHAMRVVYRLPYFDFQEVSAVRRLAELVDAGVDAEEIAIGIKSLSVLYPALDQPLAQLNLLVRDRHLVRRDQAGRWLTAGGQRLLDFEPDESTVQSPSENDLAPVMDAVLPFPGHSRAPISADIAMTDALGAADAGNLPAAVASAREATRLEPHRADLHRLLGELLYRAGDSAAAAERLRIAIDLDATDLEAWTQLGCLLTEVDQADEALSAFDAALAIHADLPEAHFHKAELLNRIGRSADAIPHWESYLRFDQRGPWADLARNRLAALARRQ